MQTTDVVVGHNQKNVRSQFPVTGRQQAESRHRYEFRTNENPVQRKLGRQKEA